MNRFRLVIVLALVVVLGCLAFLVFRSREPRYQGRPLSAWLEEAVDSDLDERSPGVLDFGISQESPLSLWPRTDRAVKEIGTNAIPFLLKWVRVKDSRPKQKLMMWFERRPSLHVHFKPDNYYVSIAYIGFCILGSDAKSAQPTLIEWTSDPDWEGRFWALRCLIATRPEREIIMPLLQRALHDSSRSVQSEAASALSNIEPQAVEITTNHAPVK